MVTDDNSGEWVSYKTVSMENQRKCILPMNDISTTIFYNTRICISAPIEIPVTWHCSKVEQTAPKGISHITFVQEEWNPNTDVFEYIDGEISNVFHNDKRVIGIWADYAKELVEPAPEPRLPDIHSELPVRCEISYSGNKPQLKLGGSYKTFTATFYNPKNDVVDFVNGEWSYSIPGIELEEDPLTMLTSETSTALSENQIKLKIDNVDELLGKVMHLTFTSGKISSEILIDLIGM